MSSFGSIKEGWLVKQGGGCKNWKKRWFLLQDNIMYYFADQKDEMSKGSIPLGKVIKIQIQEHKKKWIFEVHTNVEGRIYLIQAESEESLKDWVDAVTVAWSLHTMKDKYKDRFFHGADTYKHTLLTVGKRILVAAVRVTGVTKAVITGGGRAHKAKPAEAATIMADNAALGRYALELGKTILKSEKEPYKFESRKSFEIACQALSKAAELIGMRGAGSVNEGALASTSKQLVQEISNLLDQTHPPSFKTNMLYLVQLHAQVIEKYTEASNTDLKVNEAKRLEALGNAFPVIAKEIFPHIPDYTVAQPLVDECAVVPIITNQVRELIKSAVFYQSGETYASNSSKTLFYLLNDIRRLAMAAFPPGAHDAKYPQVGPADAQFQLSSEEFQYQIIAALEAPAAAPTEVSVQSQMNGLDFGDLNTLIPPPPPCEDDMNDSFGPMTSSGGLLSLSNSSVGSAASSEADISSQFDALLASQTTSPASTGGAGSIKTRNVGTSPGHRAALLHHTGTLLSGSGGGNNLLVGSAPAASNFRNAMAVQPVGSPVPFGSPQRIPPTSMISSSPPQQGTSNMMMRVGMPSNGMSPSSSGSSINANNFMITGAPGPLNSSLPSLPLFQPQPLLPTIIPLSTSPVPFQQPPPQIPPGQILGGPTFGSMSPSLPKLPTGSPGSLKMPTSLPLTPVGSPKTANGVPFGSPGSAKVPMMMTSPGSKIPMAAAPPKLAMGPPNNAQKQQTLLQQKLQDPEHEKQLFLQQQQLFIQQQQQMQKQQKQQQQQQLFLQQQQQIFLQQQQQKAQEGQHALDELSKLSWDI